MKGSFAVAAAVLMVGLTGCADAVDTTEEYELVVTLDNKVTAQQRDAVEQRMRAVAKVESVTLEPGEPAYESLKENFKDQPEIWQAMKPEDFGDSLIGRVTDASIAEAVEILMGEVEGVESTTIRATDEATRGDSIGVILQLKPGVGDNQRAAVEKAVHALPQAESIVFESQEDALKRLQQRCEGRPDLLAVLDASRTYASVRFEMGLGERSPGFGELQKLDGVKAVRFVPLSAL